MMHDWQPLETNRYQDHVIAHVLGTTVLGYFVLEDAAHLVLDIGFIWTIYTGGEMALLPQSVTIDELPLDETVKAEIGADVEQLHRGEPPPVARMVETTAGCLIEEVEIYAQGERRRVALIGEGASLAVEDAPDMGRIRVSSV
jgi:hypothetical protein